MTDPLAEKIGVNVQGGTVNVQNLNVGIAERLEKSGDRVRILVVAANPLGSSPLKLDHEVKTIQEALRRSRKRDNFVVEYRLAATPSELRRALLDLEPHVLHFSGHGSGEQGLLFVSDESASAIYRSEGGEVRPRSANSNEIKFVPAQPLANLLQLCEDHLECVVLNACYSDVQGNAISANIPFTIGMRDLVEDNVAIKFSQGFYDAIGAGKSYEKAFAWGKVAISFDLANEESSNILVLRKKGEIGSQSIPTPNVDLQKQQTTNQQKIEVEKQRNQPETEAKKPLDSSELFLESGSVKETSGNQNSYKLIIITTLSLVVSVIIGVYNQLKSSTSSPINSPPPISITPSDKPDISTPTISPSSNSTVSSKTATDFSNDGYKKYNENDLQGAIADYNEAIRFNPNFANAYFNRGVAKKALGDKQGAITDYNEAIRLNPNFANAYNNRGNVKQDLGDKQGAIADYNEAIRLNPNHDNAYSNRGNVKQDLGDKQGAIADYNEAIRLNPNYANSYYSRGLIKQERGEKQESLVDLRKASELYQQQGNTEGYNQSRDRIRELEG